MLERAIKKYVKNSRVQKSLLHLVDKYVNSGRDETGKDIARIEISSRVLDISEFRFFQIAHARWYGRELPEKSMEYIFSGYMMRDEVPHWARHLARQVLSCYFEGTLDPRDYNINAPVITLEKKGSSSMNTILIPVIYVIFFAILSGMVTFH